MKGKSQYHTQTSVPQLDPLVVAAHELKAPLVVARHLTQALRDPDLPLSPQEQHQHLDRLYFTCERMMRLVQQLTLSYRLESDTQLQLAFGLEPLSITEVCTQALHEMSPYARAYKQNLQLRSTKRPHIVLANRLILHDIVVNLVDNAIKHSGTKGDIILDSRCLGDTIRLRVTDSGAGILPTEMKRLKQNLSHQPQPFSGRPGTSGLGLYIASQFAAAMGGGLGVGRHMHGARFFVDLLRSKQLNLL